MKTKSQANSNNLDSAALRPVPKVVGARVGPLEPLVAKWIAENPRVATTHMVIDGLKLLFKSKGYASKRYAHLVDTAP